MSLKIGSTAQPHAPFFSVRVPTYDNSAELKVQTKNKIGDFSENKH